MTGKFDTRGQHENKCRGGREDGKERLNERREQKEERQKKLTGDEREGDYRKESLSPQN